MSLKKMLNKIVKFISILVMSTWNMVYAVGGDVVNPQQEAAHYSDAALEAQDADDETVIIEYLESQRDVSHDDAIQVYKYLKEMFEYIKDDKRKMFAGATNEKLLEVKSHINRLNKIISRSKDEKYRAQSVVKKEFLEKLFVFVKEKKPVPESLQVALSINTNPQNVINIPKTFSEKSKARPRPGEIITDFSSDANSDRSGSLSVSPSSDGSLSPNSVFGLARSEDSLVVSPSSDGSLSPNSVFGSARSEDSLVVSPSSDGSLSPNSAVFGSSDPRSLPSSPSSDGSARSRRLSYVSPFATALSPSQLKAIIAPNVNSLNKNELRHRASGFAKIHDILEKEIKRLKELEKKRRLTNKEKKLLEKNIRDIKQYDILIREADSLRRN